MTETLTKPLPRIGIDRLYFAQMLTDPSDGLPAYATPFRLQGAVELTDTPATENANFYADDGAYVQTSRPGDMQAPMVLANILPELWAALMGAEYDDSTGQLQVSDKDVPLEGAVGFRAQLSNGNYEYVWYRLGVFAKADKAYATKAENITYNTTPLTFHAKPINYPDPTTGKRWMKNEYTSGDPNGPVGLTDADLANETTGFFSTPNYAPTAAGTPIADFAVATGASGQLGATWTAAVSATLVKIQVLDPVSGDYQDATTSAAIGVGDNSATITGLTAGNTYTARLVVVSGTNNGISNTDSAAAGV